MALLFLCAGYFGWMIARTSMLCLDLTKQKQKQPTSSCVHNFYCDYAYLSVTFPDSQSF